MPVLTEDQWKELIQSAVDNDPVIVDALDNLWLRRAVYDEADPSGDLRYYAVIRDGLELVLGPAASDVATSDGGGQSGQWDQHFDHLYKLREMNEASFQRTLKAIAANTGMQVAPMNTYSLTPVPQGYIDPASPGYAGDPRYLYKGGPWPPPRVS